MKIDIEIRQMVIKDIIPLMRMLLSFSKANIKNSFHYHPFKVWKLLPLLFYLSISNKIAKSLKRHYPEFTFLSLVAVNAQKQKQIAGFAYLKFLNKLQNKSYIGRLDHLIVFEGYRNMGIGSMLLDKMISLGCTNNIRKITGIVIAKNEPAIQLYQKFGFTTKTKNIQNGDRILTLEKVMELRS